MNHYNIVRSYLPAATIGYMDINGKRLFSLEQPWRDNKTSISCIPEGTYLIKRDRTGRQQYYAVQSVPERTFIEWHPANKVSQLEGCTAFGECRADDNVSLVSSELALKHILSTIGDDDFLVTYRSFNPAFDQL